MGKFEMRTLAAAAMVLTGLFGGAAQAEPVSDRVMRFSVTFPVQSEREDLTANAEPDMNVTRAVQYEGWQDGAYFNATAVQFGADDQTWTDIQGVFRMARAECIYGDEILEDRTIPISGGLGGEVLTRRPGSMMSDPVIFDRVRFVVRVNKMYCLRATYRDAGDAEAARRFVNSLSVY